MIENSMIQCPDGYKPGPVSTGRMSDDFFIIPQNPNTVSPAWRRACTIAVCRDVVRARDESPAEEEAYNSGPKGTSLILLLLPNPLRKKPAERAGFSEGMEQQPGCASWAEPYVRILTMRISVCSAGNQGASGRLLKATAHAK